MTCHPGRAADPPAARPGGEPSHAAFEEAPAGLAHLSMEGRWLRLNRRLCEMLGCRGDELEGTSWLEAVHPGDHSRARQLCHRALFPGTRNAACELRLLRGNGSLLAASIHASLLRSLGGKPLFFTLTVGGIAQAPAHSPPELSSASASASASPQPPPSLSPASEPLSWKERYETALHATRQVVYEYDPATGAMIFSGDVETVLGHTRGGLSGGRGRWRELVHPDDRPLLDRIPIHPPSPSSSQNSSIPPSSGTRPHLPHRLDYRLLRGDGKTALIRDDGCTIADPRTGQPRLVGILTDISEQRDLALRLQHAQKMDAFGRLAGGIAHDFNNLLTVFSGYTDLLLAELTGHDPRREYLVEMQRAAERASSLTSQLLAFSRMQRSTPRIVHLGEVLDDLQKMLRRLIGEDLKLETGVADGLWPVFVDPRQLETVLINLAVNARDAMPHGGRLSIGISNAQVRSTDRRVRAGWKPGAYVQLAVSDTGIGMDPALCARIFEPFFTTKAPGQGTGLGLATCYGIVEQSGGRIFVESTPGQGSTFRIYLPRAARTAEKTERRTGRRRHEVPPGKGETVLLVEDDPAVRKIYGATLRQLGYKTLCGCDGNEALEIAVRHPEIRVVITDLVMPRMNGADLAEELRQIRPDAKVVLISGYVSHPAETPAALPPRNAFLPKPLSRDILARKLRELLERT